jgi:hypothetical protein
MKIKEISVTVSRTFNLGNFESLRLEAGATAGLDDGETPEQARPQLIEEVRASLREQHAAFHQKKQQGQQA